RPGISVGHHGGLFGLPPLTIGSMAFPSTAQHANRERDGGGQPDGEQRQADDLSRLSPDPLGDEQARSEADHPACRRYQEQFGKADSSLVHGVLLASSGAGQMPAHMRIRPDVCWAGGYADVHLPDASRDSE